MAVGGYLQGPDIGNYERLSQQDIKHMSPFTH